MSSAHTVEQSDPAELQRHIHELESQISILVAQATDPTRSAEAQSNASALALSMQKKQQKLQTDRVFDPPQSRFCASQFLSPLTCVVFAMFLFLRVWSVSFLVGVPVERSSQATFR